MRTHCTICGQEITDASGHWVIAFHDKGIFHNPIERIWCCSYCKDGIGEAIRKLCLIRRAEREERSIEV